MERGRLRQIDALRGIAAAVIALIFHQHFILGRYRTGPLDGLPGFAWIHTYGWSMVDLFFVISGFIFAHVYLTDGRMNVSLRAFTKARFARLYPLHFVMLLVAALVLATGRPATGPNITADPWHFVLNLLMLQESGLNSTMSFNVPAWSISVECICYAAFFVLAARYPRLLLPLAGALALGGCLATLGENPRVDHIARGLCGFFAGVLAFRCRSVHVAVPLALIALGAALFSSSFGISKGAILSLTCWPGLVMLAPRLSFLCWRPFTWLGDRSYSLYLIHAPVYWAVNIWLFGSGVVPQQWVWPALAGSLASVLLLADLSYRYLETPARRRLRQTHSMQNQVLSEIGNV